MPQLVGRTMSVILITLFIVVAFARVFYPVTPPWLDVILIACIVCFLLIMHFDKSTEKSESEASKNVDDDKK